VSRRPQPSRLWTRWDGLACICEEQALYVAATRGSGGRGLSQTTLQSGPTPKCGLAWPGEGWGNLIKPPNTKPRQ
jgi:hypothetical protein